MKGKLIQVLVLGALTAGVCAGQTATCKTDELFLDGDCWTQVLRVGGRMVAPQIVWPRSVGTNPNGSPIWKCPSKYIPYRFGNTETCIPQELGPRHEQQPAQITPPGPAVVQQVRSAEPMKQPEPVQITPPAPPVVQQVKLAEPIEQPEPPQVQPQPVSAQLQPLSDGKVRIFVTDDPLFETYAFHVSSYGAYGNSSGAGAGGHSAGFANNPNGKADPRTVEVQSDLMKSCPQFTVTSNLQNADYILWFRRNDHHRTKMFLLLGLTGALISAAQKVDGASLFTANGDMVYATRASTVGGTINDVCRHVDRPTPQLKPEPVERK